MNTKVKLLEKRQSCFISKPGQLFRMTRHVAGHISVIENSYPWNGVIINSNGCLNSTRYIKVLSNVLGNVTDFKTGRKLTIGRKAVVAALKIAREYDRDRGSNINKYPLNGGYKKCKTASTVSEFLESR